MCDTTVTTDAAIETLGAVLSDLAEVAGQLPVPAEEAEQVARILDRLAEEIAEAAALLRSAAGEATPVSYQQDHGAPVSDQKPGRVPAYAHTCAECGGQSRVIGKLVVQHRDDCALAARIAERHPQLADGLQEPDSASGGTSPRGNEP